MGDIVFDGVQDLYTTLNGKTLDIGKHGELASFHLKVKLLNDPTVCSCKKGKKAQETILKMYMSLPLVIRMEPFRSATKELLGEGTIVFKINGIEFARIN